MNICIALMELMTYCYENGIDYEENQRLNRAVCLLGEEVYNVLKNQNKTETEIEKIMNCIVTGASSQLQQFLKGA